MTMPVIVTAIPKHRYQLNEFQIVLLSDIESSDNVSYQYLLAVIPEGARQPELYISAEKIPGRTYQMRVVAAQASQILQQSPDWHDADVFATDALLVLKKLMGLMNEEAMQIM